MEGGGIGGGLWEWVGSPQGWTQVQGRGRSEFVAPGFGSGSVKVGEPGSGTPEDPPGTGGSGLGGVRRWGEDWGRGGQEGRSG